MPSLSDLLNQGAAHAWLFFPTAIVLGALHGLEPGHSKTMMAAFIIAIRGTVAQAVLLGLSAAISHSLIIWALAAAALHWGARWDAETSEPYFQLASAAMIFGLAAWMFWRTRREQLHSHEHGDEGPHGGKIAETGFETLELEIFETKVPPRFRLHRFNMEGLALKPVPAGQVSIESTRPDGSRQRFGLVGRDGFLESVEEIPEPHEFVATVTVNHGAVARTYPFTFSEHDHHHHHHEHVPAAGGLALGELDDAHARAHADDIARRFANRRVTTAQIVWFGLSGGLMPCPAAFTVLIVCLQLKRFALGLGLVAGFSLGLALTMVTVGALAALSVQHASKRFQGFGKFARNAPYLSSLVLVCLAAFFAFEGWSHLR
jgi:nickel/cobalt exporter